MTKEQLIRFKEAGFTLDQIIALEDIYSVSQPNDTKPADKPDDTEPADKPDDTKPADKPDDDKWTEVLTAIADLTRTVQASNINNSYIGDNKSSDASSALAHILDPYASKAD